jgi:hypothetical protein
MFAARFFRSAMLAGCLALVLSGCASIEVTPVAEPGEAPDPTGIPAPEATATPTPPDIDTLLAGAIKQLKPGMMVFNPPEKMKQFKAERVELRILQVGTGPEAPGAATQTAAAAALTGDLQGPGTPVVENLRVGTVMKARLSGGGFEIMPLNEEEQIVAGDAPTGWAWDVKALEAGDRDLNLTVTVKVIVDGIGERARDIPVITRHVKVQVNPVELVAAFVDEHWQWLLLSLIFPFARWSWVAYSNRKARKEV